MRRAKNERGSTLIIVVWALSILSLLAIGAGYQTWLEMKLTSLQLNRVKEDRLILAAVESAKQALPKDLDSAVAPGGAWARGAQGVKLDEGSLSYTVEDESGRVNLNRAKLETLQALLGDGSPDVAQSIVDWRQADTDKSHASDVDAFYASLPNPYACKRAPFDSVGELNLVKGINPERYAKLRPKVTVYGDGVNINTASAGALASLGLGASLVDKILRYRQDHAFENVPAITQKLSDLSPEETAQLAAAAPLLKVSSRDFRLHLEVWPGDRPIAGRAPDRYELVLEFLKKGQWTIKHFSRA